MSIDYKIAESEDLDKIKNFLSEDEINNSFVTPLSSRTTTIQERVMSKYEVGVWLVAQYDEDIAGCLALIPQPKDDAVEVSTYAVSSKYRGQGIGGKLLDFAYETAKARSEFNHFKYITLDSWSGNPAIAHLMEKKGYELVKEFPDPDKRPEGVNTVLYQKELA